MAGAGPDIMIHGAHNLGLNIEFVQLVDELRK
jgi:hypothetical protein